MTIIKHENCDSKLIIMIDDTPLSVKLKTDNMGIPKEVGEYSLTDAYLMDNMVVLEYNKSPDSPPISVGPLLGSSIVEEWDVRRLVEIPTHGMILDLSKAIKLSILALIDPVMASGLYNRTGLVSSDFDFSYKVYNVLLNDESCDVSLVRLTNDNGNRDGADKYITELYKSKGVIVSSSDGISKGMVVSNTYVIEAYYERGVYAFVIVYSDQSQANMDNYIATLHDSSSVAIPAISELLSKADLGRTSMSISNMDYATSIFDEYHTISSEVYSK